MLLSGTAQSDAISLPLLTFPFAPPLVVPLATHSGAISGTTSPEDASFHISPFEPATDLGPPETGGGGPVVTVTKTIHTSAESTTGMLIVSNPSSGDIGEDSITPVIVLVPGTEGPLPSQQGAIPVDYGSPVGGGGGALERQGVTSPTSGPASLADSGDESASIPYDKHVDIDGSIDPTHPFMNVQIPVGPMTQEVGVSVHPDFQGNPADAPILAELSLEDKNGDILAQLSPILNPQTNGPTDAVTVTLSGAPLGGILVVQISAPGAGSVSTASGSSNAPVAAGLTVPFVMDVQRLDVAESGNYGEVGSLVGGQVGAGIARIGTLSPTTNWPDADSGATTTTTETGLVGPESAVVSGQGDFIPAGDEFDSDSESPPDFSGRMATESPAASRVRSRPWARTW